jgi:RimJ/RimL family protein N-acetyltransferase
MTCHGISAVQVHGHRCFRNRLPAGLPGCFNQPSQPFVRARPSLAGLKEPYAAVRCRPCLPCCPSLLNYGVGPLASARFIPARSLFVQESRLRMQPSDFAALHEAALEADEIRHSLLLTIIARLRTHPHQGKIKAWTVGRPGACAAQTAGYPIVLGDLSKAECQAFAETMSEADFPGVVGTGDTALWFAERAGQLGVEFSEKIPQEIQALWMPRQVPSAPGFPRQASPKDFRLFRAWIHAFIDEAIPSDPVPSDDALMTDLRSRRHWLWTLEDKPVSMAAITRRTRNAAFINSVYTPPEHRNKGFAAAITAIVSREIFDEGRRAACLYTDLRNPASNRCYAKLGFVTVCKSWLVIRSKEQARESSVSPKDAPIPAD